MLLALTLACAPPAPRDRAEGDGFTARPRPTAVVPSASSSGPALDEPAPSASATSDEDAGSAPTAIPSVAPSASASAGGATTTIPSSPAEKLRLVGLLTGPTPKALVTTPDSLGWVLRVGDTVPRAAGGIYRVDRISNVDLQFVEVDAPTGKPPERFTLTLK